MYYIVCEGKSEKYIYKKWFTYLSSNLKYNDDLPTLSKNDFYLISGGGYPNYFDIINNAIDDIMDYGNKAKLICIVDSENMAFSDKENEIKKVIKDKNFQNYSIVIQDFCIETWGLANNKLFKQNPTNVNLLNKIKHFDVSSNDPENLTPESGYLGNKAQYAYDYLRDIFNERCLTYSKNHKQNELGKKHYYGEILKRYKNTNHIKSFDSFLSCL